MSNRYIKYTYAAVFFLFFTINTSANDSLMSKMDEPISAADFSLPDVSGKTINLSDYKGRYVLVNFWALWCSPCVKELPSMQALYESLGDEGLEILAIHVGPTDKDLNDFLSKNNISFDVVLDEEISLQGWKVPVLPISYLVDPDGQLIYEATGPREWDIEIMKELIAGD